MQPTPVYACSDLNDIKSDLPEKNSYDFNQDQMENQYPTGSTVQHDLYDFFSVPFLPLTQKEYYITRK